MIRARTRTRRLRSAALVSLASLGGLTPALAQSEVVWSDHALPTGAARAFHHALEALPSGGSLTLTGSSTFQAASRPAALEVRSLTENGTLIWSSPILVGPTSAVGQQPFVLFDAAADGSSVVALQGDGVVRVIRLDSAGQPVFDRDLASLFVGTALELRTVQIAPGGDVLVSGFQESSPLSSLPGRASIIRLNAAGHQVWRANEGSVRMKAAPGPAGDTLLASVDGNGVLKVVRYDFQGNRVWARPLPNALQSHVEHIGVSPMGNSVVASWQQVATPAARISLVRSDGSLAWERPRPLSPQVNFSAFPSNGDIVLGGGTVIPGLQRLDAQGNLLWERGASPGHRGLSGVVLDGLEHLWVGSTREQPAVRGEMAALEEMDANGVTLQIQTMDALALGPSRVADLTVDARGNILAAIHPEFESSTTHPAITAKVVNGLPLTSAHCSPNTANSTGLPGELTAIGSGAAAANNLTLRAEQLPTNTTVLFLASVMTANVPSAGGSQGTLCLGGAIGRYVGHDQVRTSSSLGWASLQLELTETPTPTGLVAVMGGQTWYFQAWYRDQGTGGAATSNFTNAAGLAFQ